MTDRTTEGVAQLHKAEQHQKDARPLKVRRDIRIVIPTSQLTRLGAWTLPATVRAYLGLPDFRGIGHPHLSRSPALATICGFRVLWMANGGARAQVLRITTHRAGHGSPAGDLCARGTGGDGARAANGSASLSACHHPDLGGGLAHGGSGRGRCARIRRPCCEIVNVFGSPRPCCEIVEVHIVIVI